MQYVFTLLLTLFFVGCEKPAPSIRIALSPWIGYDILYVAQAHGLFTKHGLNVELVEFETLTDSRRAYELGQVDAWCASGTEYIASIVNSNRYSHILLPFNYSNGADVILAGSSIDSVAALKGKKVAFEPGTLDAMVLYLALEQVGLSMQDVTAVPVPQAQVADTLQSAKIDAMVTFPPHSFELEAQQGIHEIFDSSKIPQMIIDILAVDAKLLENQSMWQHFLEAYYEALGLVQTNGAKEFSLFAHYKGVALDTIQHSLDAINLPQKNEAARLVIERNLLERKLNTIHSIMQEIGMIKEGSVIKIEDQRSVLEAIYATKY